jgi:hypothetical protein
VEKRKLLDEAARLSSSPLQQGVSLKSSNNSRRISSQPLSSDDFSKALFDEAARLTSPPRHQRDFLNDYKDKRLISILQAPISFRDKKNIKDATGWERGAGGEWQYESLSKATKDMPNTKRTDDGNIQVHVKSPDELRKCNKYAAQYLHEDKTLHFTKSDSKDFNDDLKALLGNNKGIDLGAAKKKTSGISM